MTTFYAKHINDNNTAALYRWFCGQHKPQQVMIAVDMRGGEVTARYNPEVGNSISRAEFDGEWVMIGLPACPTAQCANEIINAVVDELNAAQPADGDAVRAELEYLEQATIDYTVQRVDADPDGELAIWDSCGQYVDCI